MPLENNQWGENDKNNQTGDDTGRNENDFKGTLPEKVKLFPEQPGVYLMKDKNGQIIYVGKAGNLRKRVSSYFQKNSGPRQFMLLSKIDEIDFIITGTEIEALITENRFIKEYQPRYNVNLKDDKSYPYLKFTAEMYPRLELVRLPEKDDYQDKENFSCRPVYYGPYTEVRAVRNTMRFLGKMFPLRTCKQPLDGEQRGRPCLNFQMKLCLGPCRGKNNLPPEEYRALIEQIKLFLEGRQSDLQKRLKREMNDAAAQMDFETAALYRDRLCNLQKIIENQKITALPEGDCDILAIVKLRVEETIEDGEISAVDLKSSYGQLRETGDSITGDSGKEYFSVYMYRIREGCLKERDFFSLGGGTFFDVAEMLEGFIKNYYSRGGTFPGEIVLNQLPSERELLSEWLSGLAGKRLTLNIPRRGVKKDLLERCFQEGYIMAREKYLRGNRIEREKLKEATEALAELERFTKVSGIKRIEGYDISHLRGGEAVGSMVVFHDGFSFKSGYRRFRIRQNLKGDDLLAMEEVLRRRLGNKDLPLPDLILIDGGSGQLNTIKNLLDKEGFLIPVIALAKRNEEIYLPGYKEPLSLPGNSPSLYFLRRIRDESHRFALTYHRLLRAKDAPISALDHIPGVGAKRKSTLLRHFKSVNAIFRATTEELETVPGISEALAAIIHDHLHR